MPPRSAGRSRPPLQSAHGAGMLRAPSCTATVTRPTRPTREPHGGRPAAASRTAMASCYRRRPMPTTVLRRSVAQLFMVGLPGPTLDRATRAFLAEHPPGGVVLFKRNIRSAAQLRRLAEAIHAGGAGVHPLVALAHGKHFPGHGASAGDSHFVLPRVRRSRRALAALELVPFVRAVAAGIPALMTAHVVYPALDPRRPATLSPAICRDLLRRRLGFGGVLFSDDLEMNAVAARSTPARSAVAALGAGCDALLVCQSLDAARAAMRGVEEAVAEDTLAGEDVANALARIAALRRCIPWKAPRRAPLPGWPAHARLARRLGAV